MPLRRSGEADEMLSVGNYVPTDQIGGTNAAIVDPLTFPRTDSNVTQQSNNEAPNEVLQRRLGAREQPANTEASSSPVRQTNSPYQENRSLDEENAPISEILNNTIIHTDRPMENLPLLTLPELKLIGRRVSFNLGTKIGHEFVIMKYVGLVGTINKDTVMLIHVFRFRGNDNGACVMNPDRALIEIQGKRSVGAGPTSEGVDLFIWPAESNSTMMPTLASTTVSQSDPSNSPDPPDPKPPQLENAQADSRSFADSEKRVYSKVLAQPVAMGPIPFITFSRSSITNVSFAQESPNKFFSLFSDPLKKNFDLQCLRMFCRRYIVHTVQKNNPQNISLRAFITCRCSCPNIDDRLLSKVAKEEVEHLVSIERAAKRAKKKSPNFNRNALREYTPTSRFFSRTGVLYLTHVPQQTFTVAMFVILFSLVLALSYTIVLLYCTRVVIAPYIRQSQVYIYFGTSMCLIAGAFSLMHSFCMTVFIPNSLKLSTIRFLSGALSIGSCFMIVVVIIQYLQQATFFKFFRYHVPREELLAYYYIKDCEGYINPCKSDFNKTDEYFHFCIHGDVDKPPCYKYLEHEYFIAFNPLLCIVFLLAIFLCFEHFMHFKLIYISRMILSHYSSG